MTASCLLMSAEAGVGAGREAYRKNDCRRLM